MAWLMCHSGFVGRIRLEPRFEPKFCPLSHSGSYQLDGASIFEIVPCPKYSLGMILSTSTHTVHFVSCPPSSCCSFPKSPAKQLMSIRGCLCNRGMHKSAAEEGNCSSQPFSSFVTRSTFRNPPFHFWAFSKHYWFVIKLFGWEMMSRILLFSSYVNFQIVWWLLRLKDNSLLL